MSFGKLYSIEGNPRTTAIRAVAKANNLDIEIIEQNPASGVSKDYLELNPLGKIPAFQGSDGYILTECIAIAIYITSQNEKTTLLGKTKQDYASILRWMSFANHEVLPKLGGWFRPLIGRDFYNKKSVEDSKKAANKAIGVLENHLLVHTYLVGERVTLADLFVAGILGRGFQYVFDKEWRAEYPNVTRFFETVYHQPIYSAVVDKLSFIDEAVKYQPPKKEAAPKAAAKPKAKEVEEEEEEKPVVKAKHPLEALPKPTLVLDDWKREYSNAPSQDAAMTWFWEKYPAEEYSLWRLDFDDPRKNLDPQVWKSPNTIGGFFNRLDGSRKYIFGAASVFGADGDFVIQGVLMARGQDAMDAFSVAHDADSWIYTKLDPSKPEDKEYITNQWDRWNDELKPVTVDNEPKKYYDGKTFK
ncbi:MAG: hypothetical protein M4579_005726 [Chaenotheca gracillima]|nr:MAG: hypothetical protein M4579_005726 [Chaenotheca gracillima]